MTLEEYRDYLAKAFHETVAKAMHSDEYSPDCIRELLAPAKKHYQEWGFSCAADCFRQAVPKSDRLTLNAWCEATVTIGCWHMKVSCRALLHGVNHVHIEVRSLDGNALPITPTGYRSYFVSLPAFRGNQTVKDFVEAQFPRSTQLSLF
jgi:hypothetical protein